MSDLTTFLSGIGGVFLAKFVGDVYDHYKRRIREKINVPKKIQ